MASFVERLLTERARVWEEMKSILDTAAAEGRNLTGEEEQTYARGTASIEELGARAKKLTEDENAAKAAEESLRSLMAQTPRQSEAADVDSKEKELRSFFKGERRELVIPPSAEARALSKGTAAAGGYTIPTSFYGKLWTHLIETANLIAAGATVLTTNGGETIQIPVTTSHGAAAAVAEAATIGGTDPVFAQRSLGAFKFGQLITISRELVEDEGVDIESYLAKIVGWNLGNLIGQKFVVGAGTTEPTGLFVSSTLGVTSGTGVAGAPTMDNLIDLFYSVTAPYRNQPAAGWLMKDATAGAVRKLKDTTNNYIWQPSVIAGTPDQLLSKPVYTDPYVAATAVNAKSIAFGDFSAYVVRLVNGIRFESSNEYAFASDQITFRALIRGDGLLVDQTGAVKHFVGAAT
jgi:HK97 family phage major capsid protein